MAVGAAELPKWQALQISCQKKKNFCGTLFAIASIMPNKIFFSLIFFS
jgi:hypothetical protein